MKSTLRAGLIGLTSAGLCVQAFAAAPQTGVINITGKVTETSCVLDSSATNIDVKLPAVDKDLLVAAQSSTGRTGFAMQVTGCSDGVKVSAAFVPDSHVDAYGNLKNSAASGASDVQVQLLDQNQTAININTDDATSQLARAVTVSGSTPVTLQYYAQYYSQAGSAGAGDVAAMANYQLTYE
ncbi:major type 1 subunit fimbrin (pilin) [Pseudomonas nitritireducens]|uniref:Major type 1 subunit fimbrin (Pilin) n=1 Tax=Pseudomonas nitroreducens TaxID=46680 RepID=A0A7W7KTY6_PSENT|nr:fimbrial protein [Pseudomonas nitritireducens]MBB4868263.1 major type 1 subunit fimbrin (pilin) [Pseudomonas nitritireducens]